MGNNKHKFPLPFILFLIVSTSLFFRINKYHYPTILTWFRSIVLTGIHEIWHLIFAFFSNHNKFWTIFGGCGLEIIIPLLFYFSCKYKKEALWSSLSLLFLATSLYSIWLYAGLSLDSGDITRVTFGGELPEYLDGDWGYLHRRLGTLGHEKAVRNIFYFLSALCASFGRRSLSKELRIKLPNKGDHKLQKEDLKNKNSSL